MYIYQHILLQDYLLDKFEIIMMLLRISLSYYKIEIQSGIYIVYNFTQFLTIKSVKNFFLLGDMKHIFGRFLLLFNILNELRIARVLYYFYVK